MALTKTEIIRRALLQLGQNYPLSNVDDDTSPKAADYRSIYDMALEEAVTQYAPWHFLTKQMPLSQVTNIDVPEPYEFAYQLPSDFMQIITTYPVVNYNIAEDKILTYTQPLKVWYTVKPLTQQMPSHFTSYFIYEVASKLGPLCCKK